MNIQAYFIPGYPMDLMGSARLASSYNGCWFTPINDEGLGGNTDAADFPAEEE